MLIENPTLNRASKDILAKCMAMEDLRVIHDANAETAYFDTENRVLCLPIWEDMSNSIYDMLVGHEVSHALHTPTEGWQSFVGEGKGSHIRHMFLNIVEDARIERMIKDKFPGIRRDFATAYKEFHQRDLFELENRTIDTNMPLIDRLNIHFKLGLFGLETIPFLANEQQYVTRMTNTVTFEDVVQLSKDLYEKYADELKDEENQNASSLESGDGDEQSNQSQSSNDSGESQDGSQSGSESESGDDENGSKSESGDDSGDDSGQSQTDDTDDGESAESGDGEETGDGQQDLEYDDYREGAGVAGSTQNSYDNGIQNLRDKGTKSYEYHTLPTMKLENCVMDFNQVASIWENFNVSARNKERYDRKRTETNLECREFLARTRSTVQNMVQQFQMKQAADLDKRTSVAKTGVLDTVNMINYRWSEDIFVKNEVHADGKNHGIIMYLDWSGSMCGIIKDTVEQLLILTEFCQKVNIPFDVYAFTSKRTVGQYDEENAVWVDAQYVTDKDNSELLKPHHFSLIQFLSSDMKTQVYNQAVQNLYYLGSNADYYGSGTPKEFGMGCTPLNEAIMCAMTQVPAFQAKHGVQIVNTVFLTDGDGHSMGVYRRYGTDKSIVHDNKTRKDYNVENETNTYLQILQERTGTNTIGIRLHAGTHIRNLQYRYFDNQDMTEAAKSWKTHNFIAVDTAGYDRLFIIRGNIKVETDILENLDGDASLTKLKNAFMKGANTQKSSRVIASKLIDIIAT